MPQEYSNPARESDPHALPDVVIFQKTAEEIAAEDEDLVHEYMKRSEFRLASMNTRTREKMLAAIVEEEGIKGGWFYWYCFPGCMPDSEASGPYETYAEAKAAAQEEAEPEDAPTPKTREYGFDVTLTAFARVQATSEEEARRKLREVADCMDISYDEKGVLFTEASACDEVDTLVEIDGEAV